MAPLVACGGATELSKLPDPVMGQVRPSITPPSTLPPPIGFLDPDRKPIDFTPAPSAISRETHAIATPFNGSIQTDRDLGIYLPGQTDVRRVILEVTPTTVVPASISTIRVTGFQGVSVGIEHSFANVRPPKAIDGVLAIATLPLTIPGLFLSRRVTSPLALDVTYGCYGLLQLQIHVPEKTTPGKYAGHLELEGNFVQQSLPIEITVARYEDRIAEVMANLDAPEKSLPVTKELARAQNSMWMPIEAEAEINKHSETDVSGGWKRWIVVGSGIWDLGMLTWVGPITSTKPDMFEHRVITGPRDAPRLYVLNGPGIDVISIRERRTIARLTSPGNPVIGARTLRVSPDGDRVLVDCGDQRFCLFSRQGDDWKTRVIDDACVFPNVRCLFIEADPELRNAFVGVSTQHEIDFGWDTLLHYDLTSGEKTSVTLDKECSEFGAEHIYSARHGLLVCAQFADVKTSALSSVQLVRTSSLAAFTIQSPPFFLDRLHGLGVDDATGEILLVGKSSETSASDECIAIASNGKQHSCVVPNRQPRLLDGTKIRFTPTVDGVEYSH